MSWLHRLQQRLSITKKEAVTLLSLSLFLILGTIGRYACRQVRPVSAEYYAEIDSLFAERSAAALEPAATLEPAAVAAHGPNRRDAETPLRSEPGADSTAAPLHPYGGAEAFGSGNPPHGSDPPKNPAGERAALRPLKIDINSASILELQLLPRVGPRTAERIAAFREAYGSFRSIDELLSVAGIGPKTLEQIRPHVHVTPDSTK